MSRYQTSHNSWFYNTDTSLFWTVLLLEQFSYDLKKWFRQVSVICFINQWMKRSKHGLFVFSPNKNPNMEKALFNWPIVLQCDVKAKYRSISKKFSGMKFFHPSVRLTNQQPRAFVIRSIKQSNRHISV